MSVNTCSIELTRPCVRRGYPGRQPGRAIPARSFGLLISQALGLSQVQSFYARAEHVGGRKQRPIHNGSPEVDAGEVCVG